MFYDGLLGGSKTRDKTFLVSGKADTSGNGLVAELKEPEDEVGEGEHTVAFCREGANFETIDVTGA